MLALSPAGPRLQGGGSQDGTPEGRGADRSGWPARHHLRAGPLVRPGPARPHPAPPWAGLGHQLQQGRSRARRETSPAPLPDLSPPGRWGTGPEWGHRAQQLPSIVRPWVQSQPHKHTKPETSRNPPPAEPRKGSRPQGWVPVPGVHHHCDHCAEPTRLLRMNVLGLGI